MGRVRHGAVRKIVAFVAAVATAGHRPCS